MSRHCGCDDCQSSRGRRKEFRQSAGLPEDEVPRGHPKGQNKKKPKKPKLSHKHIWVEVSHKEYTFYRDRKGRGDWWGQWWDSYTDKEYPYLQWRRCWVCAECLEGKAYIDLSAERAWWRKERRRRVRARA
jgi:hypothetical protein